MYATHLAQLRADLAELERFPPSLYPQVVILTLAVAVLLTATAGLLPLFVPPYLVLPFVAVPGWKVYREESQRRRRRRAVEKEIRLIEARMS